MEVESSVDSPRLAWSVISETRVGDPDKVIMLGAHLDSVKAGPGINDNGSGVAALLTIMRSFRRSSFKYQARVRFAWWAAEEEQMLGSTRYVDMLSKRISELNKVRYYFNYDMLGSVNATYDIQMNNQSGGGPYWLTRGMACNSKQYFDEKVTYS